MPLNVQQQEMRKNSTAKRTENSFRKPVQKAPGTRIGTFIDWREGFAKSGKISGSYGHAVRDGR